MSIGCLYGADGDLAGTCLPVAAHISVVTLSIAGGFEKRDGNPVVSLTPLWCRPALEPTSFGRGEAPEWLLSGKWLGSARQFGS